MLLPITFRQMTGDGNTAVTTTAYSTSTTTTTTTMEAASTAPDLVVDDEHETKERVLLKYFLQEWDIVKSLLDRIVSSGGVSRPSDVQKIRSIMDKYQEQGELLEPYLESIISPLMFIIRSKTVLLDSNDDEVIEIIKPLGIIIYSLVTVCGYKSVIRFFPHHVSDLEPAVTLLEKCHHESSTTSLRHESTGEMEIKCIVLLWLYILVLVPFDISSVDSSVANTSDMNGFNLPPLVLKILAISKDYLSNAGPMRKNSGLLLSRLLTRPDMTKAFSSFFEWTHEVLPISDNANPVDHFTLLGAVEALASIFKVGSRATLLNAVSTIWSDISVLVKSTVAARSSLLRKYIMKLSQYIGLACLPHRSLSWQYVVRNTTLDGNISSSSSINSYCCISMHDKRCHEDDNMDIPEITEEIIELLLSGLKDSDTVVRWSAAKGIGRITARLTFSLLEDVLLSILELFSPGEGDGSWHGGCLALAELARRGLLVPSCLPKVVPVIVKALHYDVRRGPHSVGSHVRDAAAYVCWAFGRAYSRPDMGAIFEQLSLHLLAVACYDREVNCRRAAAAAFQENVGRQGSFPNGIYIVNTADYFSLSSRANSYLHIAANIAQFKEYLYPFAEELICHKIPHWDKNVRELAASALYVLVKYDQEYFSGYCLDRLLPCTLSSDLCTRHGATLAIGELVISLHRCGFIFSAEKQKSLSGIVPAIEKARLYRGKGGEIMRSAVSRFIQCISLGRIHLTGKLKKSLLNTLNDNLKHPNAQIQRLAVDALKDFIRAYLDVDGAEEDLTSKYFLLLKDPNAAARRGAALAVGILPSEHIAARWRDALTWLSASCLIQENPDDCDAEARVNSVHSLISLCETLTCSRSSIFDDCAEESSLFLLIKNEVIHTLLRALDDYSVDNRGDVGSWVREAAIEGLEKCSHLLIKKDTDSNLVSSDFTCILFDANVATNIIGGIAKQAVEKLDKLREISIKALVRILYNDQLRSASIPLLQAIKEIIPNDKDLKWGVPNVSFPCLVKLLQFSCYSKVVLSGLVISVGGLQDSLRKTSVEALLEYIQSSESDTDSKENVREHMLSLDLLWILKRHQKTDRIIIPTLKTVEILFSKKIFMYMKDYLRDFYAGVLDSLTIELKATRDFSKLFTGLAILGYLSSLSESTNILAFSLLLSFLAHRYPKIRKASADQVYLVILQNENLLAQSELGEALEVLTETCWEGDVEKAKEKRSQLVTMAGLKDARVTKESKQLNLSTGNKDENVSYSSLVDFSGF